MRSIKCIPVFTVLTVLSLIISISACVPGNGAGTRQGDIDKFIAQLEKSGFTVQKGVYGSQDVIALCSAGFIPNCQGGNVGAPYLAYKLPPAPGQTVANMKVDPSDNLAFAYHLQSDEAIVQVGRTPPEAAFYSYQSYLMFRYDPATKKYPALFTSIGDSINNLTIKTKSAASDTFNQPVIFISTADKGTDKLVRAAAQAAGYSTGIMNTDVVPSPAVKMGLEEGSDLFGFVSRIAVPKDKNELDAYIKDPGSTVLRLTPKTPATPDLFPVPTLRVRGTGVTELDLMPAVEDLRQAILSKYSNLKATEMPTYIALPEGFSAMQSKVNTMGDDREAAYFSTVEVDAWTKPGDSRRDAAFALPAGPDDFVIIYGVNHEMTGKAMYANCVVYGLQYLNGVAGVDSREYKDSANDYISGNPNAKYLYAWKIARQSNGDLHCLVVPTGPQRYGLGLDEKLIPFFRAYLEKSTEVGPAHNELIMERVIVFSPK